MIRLKRLDFEYDIYIYIYIYIYFEIDIIGYRCVEKKNNFIKYYKNKVERAMQLP